ncbi:MAG: GT4 family glycosyltransferase PelF [Psychrilyobacter sp.]|uniref:GT4 family glycosyltransferase PelF n=1 Tax=Psychrilyobacter sp. TaxID=2586924 RepID=UPI003C74202B
MKRQVICIIAEGSYPYVVGGVSSWINQLINGHPEKDFKILSILPSEKEEMKVKYKLPRNLLEVRTIYLADVYEHKIDKKIFMKYDEIETDIISRFINMELSSDTKKALELLSDKERSRAFNFTISYFFWEKICHKYRDEYPEKEFNNFYWSYKSVFMFLMNILQNKIPEADLYHSVSTGYAGVAGVLAKIKYNKPCYLTEHGVYAREREEDIIKSHWVRDDFKKIWIDYFYFLSKIAYKYSDKIISLFKYNSDLQMSLGAPKDKTFVVSNGVDVDRFSIIKREKTEKFIIGSILRIVPIKDVKMMIKAFKIVTNTIKNTELYLIGPYEEDPNYYEECKELIDDLNLNSNVIFTGKVNVMDYLGRLDIFLLSSISEGQPLSILEAMSSKIPVIATDVGDCRGMLNSHTEIGHAGIIVPPTSYTVMAAEIIALYNNESRLKLLGDRGYEIVNKYYRSDKFLGIYTKLYEDGWS